MKLNNKQFDKLQKTWYKKLKKSGFDDIENSKGDLKSWASSDFAKGKNHNKSNEGITLVNEAKEEYYRLAGHFLHDHKFENEIEKFIWAQHSDGLSFLKIPALLKKKGIKKERHMVWEIIHKLKQLMLSRYKINE